MYGPRGAGEPKPLSPTELKRLHREWRRRTDLRLALVLDGVQKPFNVGALLRSAAAYHVETVWTVPPAPPLDHPTVAKTALGSGRFVRWRSAADGTAAVEAARAEGFTTVALELATGSVPLHEIEAGSEVCLVLGHEDRGVHRRTLAAVDRIVFLPQLGKIGSLNVAHAGTAALYELARQRWTAPS
jgi:tRNA (guanosine-2'-O-)-methyltransferase